MCGIAGIYHLAGRPANADLLNPMIRCLAHRGPDGEGTYIDGSVGLGHRRLAIIDLSTGQQPMLSDDRSLAITFNGEIYNYVEKFTKISKCPDIHANRFFAIRLPERCPVRFWRHPKRGLSFLYGSGSKGNRFALICTICWRVVLGSAGILSNDW